MKKPTCRDWLHAHAEHDGAECLIWPFCRQPTGYGAFGYTENGKREMPYAHRYMCELVNGPPPTPTHEAAHSCGNGKGGCVHPKHLSWKTISENNLDCRAHGTHVRCPTGNRGKLTDAQVAEIRSLAGTMTQAAMAARFSVSQPTIRDILTGRSRSKARTLNKPLTADQVRDIRRIGRSMKLADIAKRCGCNIGTVYRVRAGKAYADVR